MTLEQAQTLLARHSQEHVLQFWSALGPVQRAALLAQVGAVRRVHGDDHCESYVVATGGHGHAVVCSGCGRVGEFTACDISPVLTAAAEQTGFAIDGHFLQLSGTCGDCRRQGAGAVASEAARRRS